MATKLKNFLYNPTFKIVNVLLILISVAAVLYVSFQMAVGGVNFSTNSYYETHAFKSSYGRLAHNAVEKALVLKSEDAILTNEQEDGTANIMIGRLRSIDENLSSASSFRYALFNKSDGTTITNVSESDPVATIEAMPTSLMFEYGGVYYPEGSHMMDYTSERYGDTYLYNQSSTLDLLQEANKLEGNDWVYYTAIDPTIDADDGFFYKNSRQFETFIANRMFYILIFSIGVVLGLSTLSMFIYTTGQRQVGEGPYMVFYDRIPQEIQIIITSLFATPLIAYASTGRDEPNESEILIMIALSTVLMIGVLIYLSSLTRVIKCRSFWSSLLVGRFFRWIAGKFKRLFDLIKPPTLEEGYKWKLLLWAGLWLMINLLCFLLVIGAWPIGLIAIVLVNAFALKWLLRQAEGLKTIISTVQQRRLGDHDIEIHTDSLPYMFKTFGDDLESLQEGLEMAVEERMKGEKMKAELISNVTHDLKNPLTSIINYIVLLKGKEEMDDDTRKYIGVLDEKAARLKSLIDQLVEASKASSGTIAVNLISVDIIQLIRQLCGEYQEIMDERGLDCILPSLDQKMPVEADPLILYRILDNMMSNVCNYSMEGTRVYLALEEVDEKVQISLKNISKEPLTKDVADLSQRFVRGDSSRNTEGSGLGISIALGLAKLMGAKLTFGTDGDLFKGVLLLDSGKIDDEVPNVIAEELS